MHRVRSCERGEYEVDGPHAALIGEDEFTDADFREALMVYDRKDMLKRGDRSSKWKVKYRAYRKALDRNDPDYDAAREWAPLVGFLFPELRLERVFGRAPT